MRRFALTASMIAALIAGAGHAEEPKDCSSLQKCATLSDDENRLACYDGLMRAATEGPCKPTKNLWGKDPKAEEVELRRGSWRSS